MLNAYITRAAVTAFSAAVLLTTACADDSATGPLTPDSLAGASVALVELEGTRPAFYLQQADGSGRNRVHFTGAVDNIDGNSPLVPALTDANILALRSVKWSPDGSRIAFVATVAFDQAEVIVMDADGSDARVASPNYAYVLGDVDWSPDGKRLAYMMATRPGLGGLELFVTDLSGTPRVTQVTTGSGYRGLGGTIRFASTGNSVWISQVTGEQGAPLFESIGAVRRVDLATGAITSVRENLAGEVQAVAHNGAWALVMRHKALTNGVYDNQLVRVPLVGTGPELLLVDGGQLDFARLTSHDSRLVLLRNGSRFAALLVSGGTEQALRGSGADQLSADVRE
jgi:dipeptidyl aminopeptidase/acylaminoacyl peptidase